MNIESYEDALKFLNKQPESWVDEAPKHIQAQYKLEIIAEALNHSYPLLERCYVPIWWTLHDLKIGKPCFHAVPSLSNPCENRRIMSATMHIAIYLGGTNFSALWRDYLILD